MSRLSRNILTTLAAQIIVLVLALISSMVLTRALGPEGRGLLALVLLLPELARVFGLLGLDTSNAVYAGLEPEGRRALVWHSAVAALSIGTGIAFVGGAYILLGAPGFERLLQGPTWMYLVPFAIAPLALLREYWLAILRGMNLILQLNLAEIGVKVFSLTLVVVVVAQLDTGVPGAIWCDTATLLGGFLLIGSLLRWAGALGRPKFDRVLWGRSSRFALLAYFGGTMSYLNYRIDQLTIALLLPREYLGFYVLAVEVAERLWIVPGAIGAALLPHLTNSPERDPATTATMARHAILWVGAGCLLLLALAGVLINLLFTSAFAPAAAPLRWLLPGIFSLTLSKILLSEMAAREKIGFIVWLEALAAVVNAGLNFLFIPQLGITGAAIASSISYTLVAAVITVYFLKETGISWLDLLPGMKDLKVYQMVWQRLESELRRILRPTPPPAETL